MFSQKTREFKWNRTSDSLPEFGKCVIGWYHGDNWEYPEDMYHRSVIMWRNKAKNESNNKRDYNWKTFGPSTYFGQDILYWSEIPRLPDEFLEEIENRTIR